VKKLVIQDILLIHTGYICGDRVGSSPEYVIDLKTRLNRRPVA
jgi:hypothetical protein